MAKLAGLWTFVILVAVHSEVTESIYMFRFTHNISRSYDANFRANRSLNSSDYAVAILRNRCKPTIIKGSGSGLDDSGSGLDGSGSGLDGSGSGSDGSGSGLEDSWSVLEGSGSGLNGSDSKLNDFGSGLGEGTGSGLEDSGSGLDASGSELDGSGSVLDDFGSGYEEYESKLCDGSGLDDSGSGFDDCLLAESECVTVGDTNPGRKCVFPFKTGKISAFVFT